MQQVKARIRELLAVPGSQPRSQAAAWIECPESAVPAPGRYVLGIFEDDRQEPLASPLFAAGYSPDGFLAAPPLPANWVPGMEISLHGPFGRGFNLPANFRNLALAGTGVPLRLLPLVHMGLAAGMDVALFCDQPPGGLPASVEVSPFGSLAEGLAWADYLALEIEPAGVACLPGWLGRLPSCPAEVLVGGPMPCGGLAGCGICAVNGRGGKHLLTCESGPVFPLVKLWQGEKF